MPGSLGDSWSKLTPESCSFILDQAEKNLQATIDTAKTLADRALNVMQFSVPLSLILIGLITTTNNTAVLIFYFLALFFSIVVSYQGLKLYDMYKIQPAGYKPSYLVKEEILSFDEDTQDMAFKFSAIQDLEHAIDINEAGNLKRQRTMFLIITWIKTGVVLTLLYPVVLFLFGVLP